MLSFVKDRFLRRRIEKDEKEIKIGFTLSGLLIIVLLANVAYLNLFIVKISSSKPSEPIAVKATPIPTPSESASPSPTPVTVTSLPPNQNSPTSIKTKDYFVNLGSGTNQSLDWGDVTGTLNTFDIAQYENIKEVHLESNIDVPTANGIVSVRLFNKTGNYAVWNSERSVQAQTKGDLIISQNIIYDIGPKLYQIQMKSQFGVPANLLQARLHIVAQ